MNTSPSFCKPLDIIPTPVNVLYPQFALQTLAGCIEDRDWLPIDTLVRHIAGPHLRACSDPIEFVDAYHTGSGYKIIYLAQVVIAADGYERDEDGICQKTVDHAQKVSILAQYHWTAEQIAMALASEVRAIQGNIFG